MVLEPVDYTKDEKKGRKRIRNIEDKPIKKLKSTSVQINNKSSKRRSGRLAVKESKCKYNIHTLFLVVIKKNYFIFS